MDPITHIAGGLLLGKVSWKKVKHRSVIFAAVAGGLFPDIDNFASFGDPEKYLLFHRGVTHSVLAAPVFALIIAYIIAFLYRRKFDELYVPVLGGIYIHIWMDYITSYGTMIFYPFSDHRYTLESVFIVDPFYLGTLLLLFVLSFAPYAVLKKTAILGLAFIFIYPIANLGIKLNLESRLSKKMSYEKINVSTDLLSPLYWKVIAEDKENYHVGFYDLRSGRTGELVTHKKADDETIKLLSEKDSFFKTYFWFSRYTAEDIEPDGTLFYDLRFGTLNPLFPKGFRDNKGMFSMKAYMNAEGVFTKLRFNAARGRGLVKNLN